MRKTLSRLLIFIGLFFIFHPSLWAAEFAFDYQVNYQVRTSGITHVKQDITLTNLVTDYYAQNYTLALNSTAVDAVMARDPVGAITPQTVVNNGQTLITIPFNIKAVGVDNHFTFTIEYDSRDIATKKGKVWEIIIPGIARTESVRSYEIKLAVPAAFGEPAYFFPPPNSAGTWTLNELKQGGITLVYGDHQLYSFNLIYHLENISGKNEYQEITLPPDTAFQKVILSHLSQKPTTVYTDTDGNWLAQYLVEPKQKLKIIAEGNILSYLTPNLEFAHKLAPDEEKEYLKEDTYWEQSDAIKAKAATLKSPRDVYQAVVTTLSYDYTRIEPGIERLGAAAALAEPNRAVCMEFSDLFVALARTAGIPAREIHGYAYTTNPRLQPLSLVTDVLHAWAEYYDPHRKLWIPVDPTWGNTTNGVDYFNSLDFNHIAFAILGKDSKYPYPAGSFRTDAASKDVYIDFTDDVTIPDPKYTVQLDLPDSLISGKTNTAHLRIVNTGTVLYTPQNIQLDEQFMRRVSTEAIAAIPPYGDLEVPVSLHVPATFTQQTHAYNVTFDGRAFTFEATFAPFYLAYLPFVAGGFIVLGGFFVILLSHERKKHRRQS